MSALYLIGLVSAIGCLALIDYRYKLALFYRAKQTVLTLAIAVGVFVVWDALGIALGIFYHGGSPYTLGVWLGPEFPLEELFFLVLLSYVTLLIYRRVTR